MYSYNQAGRVTAQHMSYSNDAVHFDAAYGWDTEGRMTSINYGPQYQMTYDANGRLGGMSGSDLTMTASYGPAGEMLGLSYQGISMDHYSETRTYNPMLQLTRMTVTGTSFSTQYTSGTAMDMQYIYTAGQNNGRIVQSVDGVAGETVNYTYDALNRLATAGTTNGTWGQAFAYDGFGNLTGKSVTQGSAPTLSVSFDPLTNHQNGQSYDANGNPTGMYLRYDGENRMTMGPGGYYAYDPSGKRVMKLVGTQEFYFYGIGGQKLATMVCVGPEDAQGCTPTYNVYFGGKLVKSNGAVVATDRLGSVRASSNGDRMTYYPYGEERTSTADGREKFGTYMRDSVSQDYADQRYYAVGMGRFNVPDPYKASEGVSSPWSWNRYSYTGGDPINFGDPTGQARCWLVGTDMTHPNPDDALAASYYSQIWCTSDGLTQEAAVYVITNGPINDQYAKDLESSIGADLDRAEWERVVQPRLKQAAFAVEGMDFSGDCGSGISRIMSTKTSDNPTAGELIQLAGSVQFHDGVHDPRTAADFAARPYQAITFVIDPDHHTNDQYWRSTWVLGRSAGELQADVLHELLHNSGFQDGEIQMAFFGEINAADTTNISKWLFDHCVKK